MVRILRRSLPAEEWAPVPATINVETIESDAACVYSVTGEIDLATAPELEDRIDFQHDASVIVLDLADVSFIDSTGLRAIVNTHDQAEGAGKQLRVVSGPRVVKLLEITGLSQRLHVYPDRSAALADG